MGIVFNEDYGETPLDPEEFADLRLPVIRTKKDLDKYETLHILSATDWAKRTRRKDYLNEKFCRLLHKKMFDGIWKWAGEFRKTDKNIGVPHLEIGVKLRNLFGDVQYWLKNKVYPLDEAMVLFHHKLVYIHPFPNGNGRHARLYADMLMLKNGGSAFTWGLSLGEKRREAYLYAIREADKKNYDPIVQFAIS